MTSANTAPFFRQQFFGPTGKPLTGGRIEFYSAGSATPKSVYGNRNMTVNLGNVLEFDDSGCPVHYFMTEGEYDIKIFDQFNVLVDNPLRIDAFGGPASPYPDPDNPGFLHWDGSVYAWIPVPMYPTPGNSGYLHYDAGTQTYSWVSITPDDHKVANSDTDIPGYLKDKIVDSDTVRWSEIIVDGNSVIKADMIDLDKVPAVVVWAIMAPTDPQTAPFGLSNDDVNHMIETGFGVASQMEQSTFQSNLSIWYATGTYWGDAVWEEKSFPDGSCITNLNHTDYDYLHTHPESRPVTDASNYPAGIYSIKMVGDGLYWEPLLVEQYPDPSYNITSFLKYDADNKVFVWLDAKLLEAKPIGPAGGDLFGTYPNPRVKELTGVPAMLTPSIATFDWKYSGSWAAGAGIGFGYGYVNGVKSKVWMAISQLGELQISYDEWKTTVYVDPANAYYGTFTKSDTTIQPYNDVQSKFSGRYAAVTYVEIPGTGKFCWMFGAEYQLFGLEDIPANYNANGSIKVENIFRWTYSGRDPNTINSNGDVLVITGNSNYIQYAEAADIDWANKTITFHDATITGTNSGSIGVFGGNGCDGSGFMSVGRDSGIVVKSADGKVWTVSDVLTSVFQDGTAMTKTSTGEYTNALPMRTTNPSAPSWSANGNAWGGMLYANDMWIVVNGKPAPTTMSDAWSPFMFTYDQSNWNGYKPTPDELAVNYTYTMYKIAYGHGKTFATNADPMQVYGTQPSIYRLLMDEIPSHRKLVAEKGLDVIGTLAILDLPNATSLATDEDGNVIAGQGAVSQIGDAPKVDYAFSPYNGGTRKWIPNGKASGPVEAIMGPLVRNEVNNTVTVPAYTVQLFDNGNFLGQPLRYDVAQTTLNINTPNIVQYIIARYIAPGVAMTILTPFINDIDWSSAFPLFIVERVTYTDGSSRIHQTPFDTLGEGLAQKINIALVNIEPYRRDRNGGLIISSTGLHVGLTASTVYAGVVPHSILSYDSNTDKLFHCYKVGGVWTYAVETVGTVNNTQYQGETDLVTLGTNKYKNVWIYRSIGDDKECFYVDGTAEYNTSDAALLEAIPSTVPDIINWHCLLVGRITVQKNATSGYITQSAFTNPFVGATSPITNTVAGGDLSGTYPNPLVDELSGSGNTFRVVTNYNEDGSGSFIPNSSPFAHYSMAIKSEGGSAMFTNLSNDVYFSKNGGLNWKFLYNLGGGSGMDLTFGRISSGVYGWAVCGQNQIIWFEDLAGNYDANGYPLLSAWKSKSRATSDWADIANNSNTGDWFFALEAAGVFYSPSLSTTMTFTQVIPQGATGSEGGIFVDQTNNRIVYFERTTGRVWWANGGSYANPTDWTEVLLNGVPVLKAVYPQMGISGKGVGAGVECKNICTFVGDVTIYATNVTDATTYQRSTSTVDLPKLWNVCTDGVNVFGVRDDWSWSGIYPYKVIFQLYNDVIPAHKTFVAEKDLVVLGNEYIPNLPNCSSLATDPNGKIIAGSGSSDHLVISTDVDTVPSQLVHKLVDSTGAELSTATHGAYGTAVVIPTAVISGTPNGLELFSYSISEGDPHTIAQDGTDSGNCSGNRGFAFVANQSRLITKAKMQFTQAAGNYRIGLYDSTGARLGRTSNVPVAPGMHWIYFETPVQLIGGTLYYMAYWLSDTTGNVRFPCVAGRSTYGADPLPQIYDINNEMPISLQTSGTKTGYRPWMFISE